MPASTLILRAADVRSAAAILDRFDLARATTRRLAEPLSAEDCQAQSMPDASPVKWHLAHTTWFFETFVLEPYLSGYAHRHESYRELFNSYYNGVGAAYPRPHRGLLTRPTLREVLAWRAYVEDAIRALAARCPDHPEILARIELGIHHEQQHQELILMDAKHLLWCNPMRPAYQCATAPVAGKMDSTQWVEFPGGQTVIGHRGHQGFAYDNETPAHPVLLQPYRLAHRLVTQGEFLDFIQDGGYRQPEWWLSLGWDTLRAEGWQAPLYWEKIDGEWMVYTLQGLQPLDPALPVTHISYFEADAFARWAGARLPTEAEWEAAAHALVPSAWDALPANLLAETGVLAPQPAPSAMAAREVVQLVGDAWEWTSSAYAPYPGYRPPMGALGEYNGKFMCNQYVLRGGSFATPASHIRLTYRNFFAPNARWPFTGLRLARDA